MPTLKLNSNGKLILKNGKASCECCVLPFCSSGKLSITYDWSNSQSRDLDTGTEAFGGKVGYACSPSNAYLSWSGDNTSTAATEKVCVDVIKARTNGLWSSSCNILCHAGWFAQPDNQDTATLIVSFMGLSKTKTIHPQYIPSCATHLVATIIFYGNDFDLL